MKNSGILILLGMLLMVMAPPVWCQSEEDPADKSHDPFHLPRKRSLNHPVPAVGPGVQWHLTGIITGPAGEKLAILNDRLVSEGDKVSGGKVEQIESDHIVLKGTFGTKELRILPFSSEGDSPE